MRDPRANAGIRPRSPTQESWSRHSQLRNRHVNGQPQRKERQHVRINSRSAEEMHSADTNRRRAAEDLARDEEIQHRVAEEFEALVRGYALIGASAGGVNCGAGSRRRERDMIRVRQRLEG